MRYMANPVAIIKGGDRQLKFVKIKKYNNKYFAVRDSGIYELDDQYEYRYHKTGVYFYNFNNSKPLSLSGMMEIDEKLKDVGDAHLFNKERHIETMRMINPESTVDPLEMPPDRTEEMSADTRRFLQDYQTDDEYGKTNLMVNVHLQKKGIPMFSPSLVPLGMNKGDFAVVQIGHRRIDIVPMKIHNAQAYTPYGVFEVSRDNHYLVKKQVLCFFVISDKEEDPATKIPKQAQKEMGKMVRKKKWGLLQSFRKPRAEHYKKEPKTKEKKQSKNISLSSEKTLQQYKADDPAIFQTTVNELFTSKVAVAEKLSDPLKKVIPIALIFGGVMGLMIVMSNAPMVIDKIAEVTGMQPPKVIYLSPDQVIDRGLDVNDYPQACVEEGWTSFKGGTQITCSEYSYFDGKEGGILPYCDEQHSQYDVAVAEGKCDTPSGTGEETMVQAPDTIPPVLVMPETITEDSDTRGQVIVRYAVGVSDNSGESIEVLCEPKSGSIFPLGETIVKCTAVDSSGNIGFGEFLIIVTGNPEDRSIIPEIVSP